MVSNLIDAPWSGPQPGYPPCPSCIAINHPTGAGGATATSTMMVTVAGQISSFTGSFGQPTLRVRYTDGTSAELDLSGDVKSLSSSAPFHLQVGIPNGAAISSVTMNGVITNSAGQTTSTVIPILHAR
jgi:hypothetical protein